MVSPRWTEIYLDLDRSGGGGFGLASCPATHVTGLQIVSESVPADVCSFNSSTLLTIYITSLERREVVQWLHKTVEL